MARLLVPRAQARSFVAMVEETKSPARRRAGVGVSVGVGGARAEQVLRVLQPQVRMRARHGCLARAVRAE